VAKSRWHENGAGGERSAASMAYGEMAKMKSENHQLAGENGIARHRLRCHRQRQRASPPPAQIAAASQIISGGT